MTGVKAVRFRKGSTVFHVYGERAGEEGVWLAHGQVDGIYDAPVTTTWKAGAFQEGGTQRAHRNVARDMLLGFHIVDTTTAWEFNDSEFRLIFDYELDPWWGDAYTPTVLEVETDTSGVRSIDVLMYEPPSFDMSTDPAAQQHSNVIFKLRAGQPFWSSADHISKWTGSGSGQVTVTNPTDRISYQKWVLTPGSWTLPDFAWQGPPTQRTPASSRTVPVTVTAENGGAVIDLDGRELMFRDLNNTNILGQQAGVFFVHAIPPYTPPTALPVSGSGTVELRVPQRWSRPWGLER